MGKQTARRQGAEARGATSKKVISLRSLSSLSLSSSIALAAVAALLLLSFSASLALAASPDATSPTTRDAEFSIDVAKMGAAAEGKAPAPAAGNNEIAASAGAPSPAPATPFSSKTAPAAAAAAAPSSSTSKEAKPAAPVPLFRGPSKWKATGPPFAGSAYSFFVADGKKQPVLAYQEASKGVGAGSAPGGATRLYRLQNGGSWAAAAAPLPAPSMTATADAVDDGDASKPDLKTIDSSRAVDYFLNGVAVSPQSGLVFVVFFPFATTDAAVEKAKAATPLVYATTATGEDAGWVLVGAPSSAAANSSSDAAATAAVPVGLGRAGPWRGAAVAADGDEVFVAYTANAGGNNGTLTVSKATVKKNSNAAATSSGKGAEAAPDAAAASPLLTTTTWSRVGSKPLEVSKTSPGRAFVGASGGHLVAGFENGDPFPGIAFERWSKKIGDSKFDDGRWERACGGSNANGTVPDSGNSQYDAPFLVGPDGTAYLGTSPGTATNAVAAAAAALLTSTGFDQLDKLGKLPNQVWSCKPGSKNWKEVFSGANGATAEGVEGRQSLTALALGPKDAVFAAYEGQAGPFVSKSGGNARDGSSKPATVGGQGLGGRVLGRPVGLVVDAGGVPTIALTNRGFGNTTGDSEDFREIVVKTCKEC